MADLKLATLNKPSRMSQNRAAVHGRDWSDDDLIRALCGAQGVLTADDFKGTTNGNATLHCLVANQDAANE